MGHPSAKRTGVAEAEFLELPESMERIELLDGEVIVPLSPTFRHQRLVLDIAAALRSWARAHPPAAVGLSPLDVRFGPGRILQPDVLVVLQGLAADVSAPLDVLPDLVVEVMSRHRAYDRITKRVVYAEAGVPEYWVVDAENAQVEVYEAEEAPRLVDTILLSELLPDFQLDLRALFGA